MSWQDIPGWFSWEDVYDEMVATASDGDVIVELGVAFGRSIAYLARKVIDSKKDITIYGIDPWLDDGWNEAVKHTPTNSVRPTWGGEHAEWARSVGGPFNAFTHSMRTHAPEELERIRVLRGYSHEYYQCFEYGSLHGVLVDGNHNYAPVMQDLSQWYPLVKKGGIFAGDDCNEKDFPGVVQACKEYFGSWGLPYEIRRDWIWVHFKGLAGGCSSITRRESK